MTNVLKLQELESKPMDQREGWSLTISCVVVTHV
ncbi:class III lanthipeptide [Kurthia gibsonii]|nr:class III lanthipeptide [Kurthia gibsonii]